MVVPIEMVPLVETRKLVAVEEPTTNSAVLENPFGLTERRPQGVVLPILAIPETYNPVVVALPDDI